MRTIEKGILSIAASATMRMLAVAAMVAGVCASANAAFDPVVVRSSLQADDHVDWSGAGAVYSQVATNPFSLTSAGGGTTVNVSMPSGSFSRYDQNFVTDDFSGGWNGNFAPGDHVLFTGAMDDGSLNPGPIKIVFSQPVYGVGAQIQSVDQTFFTAEIQLFDASNNLLASATRSGFSSNTADNTAIYLGMASSSTPIYAVQFSITTPTANAFAINTLDLASMPVTITAVPEPSTIAFIFFSAALLIFMKRGQRVLR